MKNFQIIALLATFLSFSSFAEESSSEKYDCKTKKQEITDILGDKVECWQDADCSYFNYGYPWQTEACFKGVVSKSEEQKTLQKLALTEQYSKACIDNNPAEKKKVDDMAKKIESTKCDLVRVYCLHGYCRTQSYAILNNNDPAPR